MDKKGFGPEIKVGIFVLIGLIILAYMSIRLGKIDLVKEKGYHVSAVFDSVSGLVKDSPVEMAGIEIGRVKDVTLKDGQAKVDMVISPQVKIKKDAQAMVRTKGVLGDKFIEIMQGKEEAYIPPEGTIAKTVSAADLDQLLVKVEPALDDIQSLASGLNEFVGDKENQTKFKALIANLRDASASFKSISGDVEAGKGTLGKLVKDETLYNKAKKTVSTLEETVGTLSEVAQKVERGEGTLGKLVNDETLYNKAKDTVDTFHNVAQKVDKGEGTLGKLVNDPSLYDETKKAVKSVTKATTGIQEQVPITVLGTVVGTVLR
jgi:phospholipid/cholesterol/gamma-HCH transport system substrate-binding protein